MNSLSVDDLSARLCTICLNTVVDDNSRGKAELVCGHLFHLDCIGSEFNYRTEMKCPNCRVVESGEWLIPDEDIDDDEEISMQVINRRFDLHIYSHGGRARDQNGGEEGRSPAIAPTVHYHHHHHSNIVLPPSYGGATAVVYDSDPLSGNTMLRTFGNPQPQGSDAGRRARVDHVVLPDRSSSRPNVGDMRRTHYHGAPAPQHLNSAAPTVDSMARSMQQRQGQNAAGFVQTNMAGYESMSSYNFYDDPSLDLTLNSNPSEDQSNEEQHGTHEAQSPHGAPGEGFWFQPLDQ